jgi:hypothetical protein
MSLLPKVQSFKTALCNEAKKVLRELRFSQRLTAMNDEISINIERPKEYPAETYGLKNARNYYTSIGVEKTPNGYKIPRDKQKCIIALKMLISFATSEGWDNRVYNATCRQGILDEYVSLASQMTDSAGDVSKLANDKGLKNNP